MPNKKIIPKEKKKTMGRPIEYTPANLKKLGDELIAYCEKDGVWHPSEFSRSKKKSLSWLLAIEKRHPEFTQYHMQAKEIIANKMIKLGIESGSVNYLLGRFIPIYLIDVKAFDKQIADEQLERQMKLEEHKKKLGEANNENASNSIENAEKLAHILAENNLYKKKYGPIN